MEKQLTHKEACANGGRKRWAKVSKKDRSKEMRRIALIRHSKSLSTDSLAK